MDLDLDSEVLGEEPTEPLGPRLWRWLRAHPVALVLIVVLALAVVGTGGVILTRPVHPAGVTLVDLESISSSSDEPRWLERPDGRPSGRPGLSMKVGLQRTETGTGPETQIIGITGPGIVAIENPPVTVPPADPVEAPLKAALDCDRLPDPLPANAYRLRISARSADPLRRPVDSEVSPKDLSPYWARVIRLTCSAWLARRDLTVTALTATVDASKPRIAMSFTVANRGARPAYLDQAIAGFPIRFEGKLPIVVPPHGSATATGTLVLDTCDSVKPSEDGLYSLGRGPALSSAFNVAGRSGGASANGGALPGEGTFPGGGGSTLPEDRPLSDADLDVFGATGVLIDSDPARTLREALNQACAGLRPMLVMIAPDSLRYDAGTQEVTVPVRVLVGAAIPVRSVRLRSRPDNTATSLSAPGTAPYVPLWKPTGALVPDDTGQLRLNLRYRAPKDGSCPERGAYLPDIVATLEVVVGGRPRQLAFSGTPNLFDDPAMLAVLCGRD